MLQVVMYHYVRDSRNTAFPALKFMDLDRFHRQVLALRSQFEMATLEAALACLRGEYRPTHDLCLLTFDDGLAEHYRDVFPLLAGLHIQGVFFVITSALDEHAVAPVHMNHMLMAVLGFEPYRAQFLGCLDELRPGYSSRLRLDPTVIARTYTWDRPEVGWFKYLVNFALDPLTSDSIVRRLFVRHLGDEAGFAGRLYVSWCQAREMSDGGMVIGAHSHSHRPLATLSAAALNRDLALCARLLRKRLPEQPLLPFCYPYGKKTSFNAASVGLLRSLGFCCAFSTEKGWNEPGEDLFRLRRVDCKDAPVLRVAAS